MTTMENSNPFADLTLADLVAVRHTFTITSLERCGLDEAVEEEIVRRIMALQGKWKDWQKSVASADESNTPAPDAPPPPPPAD